MRRKWVTRTGGSAALALFILVVVAAPAWASSGWVVFCGYSHSAKDDPIVYPGEVGASHLHDFFGNTTTGAASTDASMRGRPTTCETKGDTAAFWVPALFRNGKRILPAGAPPSGTEQDYHARTQVYYQTNLTGLSSADIVPIPYGLRMVAGVSTATSPKQNPLLGREIYWGCSNNQPDGKFTAPIDCATGIESLHVGFPNCWDGVHLDSADHRSHMAYPLDTPNGYMCPPDHPAAIPRVIVRVEYPVGTNASGISLSSGKPFTAHGDFWNTWDEATLTHLTVACLNAGKDCGVDPGGASPASSPVLRHLAWALIGLGIAVIAFVAGVLSATNDGSGGPPPRNTVEPIRRMKVPP